MKEVSYTKRVAHLSTSLNRYNQRMLGREAFSLQENGYDVLVVVNDMAGSETLENGVKILSTGFVSQGRWQRMTEGARRVYELGLAQNADIYHLHETELLPFALKLKQHGKKVIFDSHEFYGENIKGRKWIPWVFRRPVSSLYTWYETYVCRQIDGVISVAYWKGKDWFEGRSRRSVQVGNYPRADEYRMVSIPDYSVRTGVCYSGGLVAERGITNLVEAGKRSGTTVCLAGTFSSKEYEQMIMQDSKHIRYLGFINSRKELFQIYADCAIGVSLLLDVGQYAKLENLPTKVYEYMAAEMPVILSDFPYNRKLIEKYHFGLVANPADSDDIAEKIVWLLEHPKDAEKMGKNGKRLLEEQFTWERAAEPALLQMYKEIE